jgi:hypothetical protein
VSEPIRRFRLRLGETVRIFAADGRELEAGSLPTEVVDAAAFEALEAELEELKGDHKQLREAYAELRAAERDPLRAVLTRALNAAGAERDEWEARAEENLSAFEAVEAERNRYREAIEAHRDADCPKGMADGERDTEFANWLEDQNAKLYAALEAGPDEA